MAAYLLKEDGYKSNWQHHNANLCAESREMDNTNKKWLFWSRTERKYRSHAAMPINWVLSIILFLAGGIST